MRAMFAHFDVVRIEAMTNSLMTENLGQVLSAEQMEDLLTFLLTSPLEPTRRAKTFAAVVVIAYAVLSLIPLAWIFATSFRTPSDAIAIDILINSLRQLSQEYVSIERLYIGGENEDWAVEDNDEDRSRFIYDGN